MHRPKLFCPLATILAPIAMGVNLCHAQDAADYPNKPVRVIVASAPGGASDTQARLFAQKMSENLKRQFIIENRPGAGGTIGYGLAAKAPADGYTLLSVVPTLTFSPALHANLPYDPLKDFAPVSLAAKAPYLVLAHPALPVRSVKELVTLARAQPGAINIGATNGSPNHLAAAWFTAMANVRMTLIPYKGIGQVMVDTMAGEVQVMFGAVLISLPHVKNGKLRALAVSSAARSRVLPELPSIAEAGVHGYDMTTWHGWVAPAGAPAAIVNLLSAELAKAVRAADITRVLAEDGAEPVGSTPAEFRQLIADEVPRWRQIVRQIGMRME